MNRGQQLTLLGAIGLLAGAIMPWVSITSIFGTITKAGYEGDGIITGAIGLLLLIGSLLSKGRAGRRYSVASVVFALIAGSIALWDLSNVSSVVADIDTDADLLASIGAGLYITLIGAVLAVIGGLQRVPGGANMAQASSQDL